MKRILGLFWVLALSLAVKAGNVGEWNLYLAYHNALANQAAEEAVFANFDGNLLAYHPADETVKLYSKLDGLKGKTILRMGYSETEKCLMLIYDDLLIDLFYPADGHVVTLPQVKDAGIDGLQNNQLFIDGEDAVMAMSNGLVHISLNRQEVVGYYMLDRNIKGAAIHDGVLYAGAEDQLLCCSTDANPLDKNEWKSVKKAAFFQFMVNGNAFYGLTNRSVDGGLSTGLWLIDGDNYQAVSTAVFPLFFSQKNKLVVADPTHILIFDAKQPTVPESQISFANNWKSLSRTADGTLWACDGEKGMQAYKISENTLKAVGTPVGNYGPRRDLCYYMRYEGERLLIAGGHLDPYDIEHHKGTIITRDGDKWGYFQEEGIPEKTGLYYRDVNSIAQDPKDPTHHFATAAGGGLYEFKDGKFVKNYNVKNSPLRSAAPDGNPNYVRMDGLNYDAEGNLWMANNGQPDTILRVLRPNGKWKGIYVESIRNAPTCEKTLFDRKGRLWMASRRTVSNHDGGLLCLDYNGTLDNQKDDVSTYRSTFVNQDGKPYSLQGVYAIAEDLDGSIWVGTKVGLFLINDPDNWHSSGFYVIQVKVPRNDGTNLADYLLDGLPISALAIDAAGRKWVGTETNGLYLVSKDGTQILEHFDVNNSPLLSNYIYSLAANGQTGEIMIGTDKGLCSYQSAVSTPETSLNENRIKVYPNPVRPEYHGDVHVTGLTDNAEVKVVSTSGQVVASGRSSGGTFIWNGRGLDGARVGTGVYYLMIATTDGNKGVAAKVVVI